MQKKNTLVPDYAHQAVIFLFHFMVLSVPFFFTWVNEELFEFNKMLLVYGSSILIGLAWSWRMIINKKIIFKKTYLDWAILAFVVSQVLSTIFSIHPRTSIFGYYTRFHGGLLSTFSYVTLYYALVSNFNRQQFKKLLTSIFIAGLGVALYAIPEHFGHSPSCLLITGKFNVDCWVQKVQDRIFGTFGQPNWLAAYAVLLLPIGVSLFINRQLTQIKDNVTKNLGLLAGITSIALLLVVIFTQSRSGFLGLGIAFAGYLIGLAILFFKDFRSQKVTFPSKNLIIIGAVFLGLAAYYGTPYTPSVKSLLTHQISQPTENSEQPTANRLDLGGTDSGEIRKIVWTGAFRVWQRYPIFGSGVETFAYSYYKDRPMEHNLVSEWDFLYNKAHNELLNFLATTGIVGLTAYLSLFIVFAIKVLGLIFKKDEKAKYLEDKILAIGMSAGLVALFISNTLGFSTVMVSTLMFLFFAALEIISNHEPILPAKIELKLSISEYASCFVTGLIAFVLTLQVINIWRADYLFTQGSRLVDSGELSKGGPFLQQAIKLRPDEDLFYDKFAITLTQAAFLFAEQKKLPEAQSAAQSAIIMSNMAIKLNPVHLNLYKTRVRLLSSLGTLDPELLQEAQANSLTAMKLAPTDPKLVFNLGLITQALGDEEGAVQNFVKAIEMKDDYVQVRKYLADYYVSKDQTGPAIEQLKKVLAYFPEDQDVAGKIATLEAKLKPSLQ
ncbi:O-antigen ligase family protein [Patescibacteria group bacterium]|nr:O-antigen ligase family protein [Patescibacteria group bacterium]